MDTLFWIRKDFIAEIQHKSYYYDWAMKLKTNWISLNRTRNLKEVCIKCASSAKETFITETLEACEGHRRKLWKTNKMGG